MYAFFDATYHSITDVGSIETLDEWAYFGHNKSGEHTWDDEPKGNIDDLKILEEQYSQRKILNSIGGKTKSQNLPAIAQSIINFMNLYP